MEMRQEIRPHHFTQCCEAWGDFRQNLPKPGHASHLFNSAHQQPPVLPLPAKSYLVVISWFRKQNFAWRMSVPFTECNALQSVFRHHPWGWVLYGCATSWILMSRFPITLMKRNFPDAIFTIICYRVKSSNVASLATGALSTLRLTTI